MKPIAEIDITTKLTFFSAGVTLILKCDTVKREPGEKAANFNINTINQKIYVFGIAYNENEKKEIIQEAKQIVDVKEVVTSILMVSDLSRQRE